MFARLTPAATRPPQQALVVEARKLITPHRKQAIISVQSQNGIAGVGGRGATIQYALVGPDLEKLDEYTDRALKAIDKAPSVVDADRTYLPGKPELRLAIDRRRAADLGIRVEDVSQTVNALMAGQKVTTYNAGSDQYDVLLKAQDAFRRTPETLADATVRTGAGSGGAGRSAPGSPS